MSKITVVIDENQLKEAFEGFQFPFSLKTALKSLEKKEGKKYILDEIVALLKRDNELKTVDKLTSNAIKTCGVFKIRIKKANNKGKSNGYRVVFLLVINMLKGFVLDIYDHDEQDDLTDFQKKFCNNLVKEIDDSLKGQGGINDD